MLLNSPPPLPKEKQRASFAHTGCKNHSRVKSIWIRTICATESQFLPKGTLGKYMKLNDRRYPDCREHSRISSRVVEKPRDIIFRTFEISLLCWFLVLLRLELSLELIVRDEGACLHILLHRKFLVSHKC